MGGTRGEVGDTGDTYEAGVTCVRHGAPGGGMATGVGEAGGTGGTGRTGGTGEQGGTLATRWDCWIAAHAMAL